MKIKKAVIPAAGLGTRFLPITKAIPKEMLNLVDRPAIEYLVREIVECGIEDILIITSSSKESIADYFDSNYKLEEKLIRDNKKKELEKINEIKNLANIYFIRQHEQLGLGHAVLSAKNFVGNDDFLLALPDELVLKKNPSKELINKYEEKNKSVIGLLEVDKEDVDKYGIAKINNDFKITDMVEKPKIDQAPSNLAIIGRYIISHKIFPILEETSPGKNGEIQLTDALIKLMEKDHIYGVKISGKRYDTGSKIGYLKAFCDIALENENLNEEFKKYLDSRLKND